MEKLEKLVLIDGHSILNRAFYGVPELTNSAGLHTNAIYGFLNIMFKILDEEKPEYLAVAFDVKAPTFRHELYGGYKGTRKPMPPELHMQTPIIIDLLRSMNVAVYELPGYEADDILGTLSVKAERDGIAVRIISGDRDMLQLATSNVMIRIPKTKKGVTEIENYFDKDVYELYHVTPEQFTDVKALMGDASDNIPGIRNIGEKTAVNIISAYGSIENAYEHAGEIMPKRAGMLLVSDYDNAVMSKKLAAICTNAPIRYDLKELKIADMFNEASFMQIKKLEFKSFFSRFNDMSEIVTDVPDGGEDITIIDKREDFDIFLKNIRDAGGEDMSLPRKYGLSAYEFENAGKMCMQIGFYDGKNAYVIKIADASDRKYIIYKLMLHLRQMSETGLTLALFDIKDKLGYLNIGKAEISEAEISEAEISETEIPGMPDISYMPEITESSGMPDMGCIADISICAYLLNPLKSTYLPDDIAGDYLDMITGVNAIYDEKQLKLVKPGDLEKTASSCLALEARIAYMSCDILTDRLKEMNMYDLYKNTELPLAFALYDMERAGVRTDREALKRYGVMLGEDIGKIEKEIFEELGEDINLNSPKQLGELLFGKLKLPGSKKTKTGYSTSANILEALAPDYPIIGKILEYRQLAKLKSTYADGLAAFISSDGRIHGKFNQTVTATGRISSTEPNLQNIPIRMDIGKKIRRVFIPDEGKVFIDADYSQIELRILAAMSGDENLISAYNGEDDIHRITASKVFKVPMDDVTQAQRRNAKAVNFGIIYGISSFGLSRDLSISKKEAAEYIKQYFETYPGVKEYLDGLVNTAKEKKYAVTMFNRIRPIPELDSSNFMQRSFGERIAMNSPIQGTAADIMKKAMVNVAGELKKRKLQSRIVLQVHDELLIEAPRGEVEIVKEIVRDGMKNAASLKVPLEIDMGTGLNWLDAH